MVQWFKIISLCVMALWSASVWAAYFQAKDAQIPANYELSDAFWAWEAEGRLRLVDAVLDLSLDDDLTAMADILMTLQNQAYAIEIEKPRLKFISMRGNANGLYVPEDKTIYLNNKMNWTDLGIERFAEVVLHENMHHILTHSGKSDDDFKYLSLVGFHHHHFAMDNKTLNPQEYVAYRTQRAGRYVAMNNRNLTAWDITTRMQEIRAIQNQIKY